MTLPARYLFALLTILGTASALRVRAQVDIGLFRDASPPTAAATAAVEAAVVRTRWISVDTTRLPSPASVAPRAQDATLTLNFFPDATFAVMLDRIETTARGYVWIGRLASGEPGSATLSVSSGVLAATLRTADGMFQVRYVADGVYEVRQIDASRLPPEAPPLVAPAAATADAPPVTPADDGATIDLLVVYTQSVGSRNGGNSGVEALINLGVSRANQAYANSGVIQRLRLAAAAEVTYTETFSASTDLSRLRVENDGFLDTVHALRDAARADIVVFLVHTPAFEVCGLAYLTSTASSAFGLVDHRCISNETMAHELGHNMGLHHDIYVAPGNGAFPYSHGYVNQAMFAPGAPSSKRWRDVMAYVDQCSAAGMSCPRILHFASPSVSYLGDPTGLIGSSEGARTLNETRVTVSNFRASTGPPGSFSSLSPADGIVNVGTPVTLTWGISSGATGYEYCVDTSDDNDCFVWTSVGSATSVSVPLAPATQFFWNARATKGGSSTQANGGNWRSILTVGAAVYNAVRKVPLCIGISTSCDSGVLVNGRLGLTGGAEPHAPNTLHDSCNDGSNPGGYHATDSIDRVRVSTIDSSLLGAGRTIRIDVVVWATSMSNRLDLFYTANAAAPAWTYLTTIAPPATGLRVLSAYYVLPAGTIQAVRARLSVSSSTNPCPATAPNTDVDDLAFRVERQPFINDTLVPGVTPVVAAHVTELRTRINALRLGHGLSAAAFTDPTIASGTMRIRAVHVAEMRTAIDDVYRALWRTVPNYTQSTLTPAIPIRALHIAELRSAVAALEP